MEFHGPTESWSGLIFRLTSLPLLVWVLVIALRLMLNPRSVELEGGSKAPCFVGPIGWNISPIDKLRAHLEQRRNGWLGKIPLLSSVPGVSAALTSIPVLGNIGGKENELQYLARAGSFRSYTGFFQAADNCSKLRDKAKAAAMALMLSRQRAMSPSSVPMCLPASGKFMLSPDQKKILDNSGGKQVSRNRISPNAFTGAEPIGWPNCRLCLEPGGRISTSLVRKMMESLEWPSWLKNNPICACIRVEFDKLTKAAHSQLHDVNIYTDMPSYISDILDIVDNFTYQRIMNDCGTNVSPTYNNFNNKDYREALVEEIYQSYKAQWNTSGSWGHANTDLEYAIEAGVEDPQDERDAGGCDCDKGSTTSVFSSSTKVSNHNPDCFKKCLSAALSGAGAKQDVVDIFVNMGKKIFNLTDPKCCTDSVGTCQCQQIYDTYTKWLSQYYAEYDTAKCLLLKKLSTARVYRFIN